jgi:hypothetical protein
VRLPRPFRTDDIPGALPSPSAEGPLQKIEHEIARAKIAFDEVWARRDDAALLQGFAIAEDLARLRAQQREHRQHQDEADEKHALTTRLRQTYARVTTDLDKSIEVVLARNSVPDIDDIATVFVLGQRAEALRGVLFAATGERQFARRIDALDRLRFVWHRRHLQCLAKLERIRHRSVRPRVPPAPWEADASRLYELTHRDHKEGCS